MLILHQEPIRPQYEAECNEQSFRINPITGVRCVIIAAIVTLVFHCYLFNYFQIFSTKSLTLLRLRDSLDMLLVTFLSHLW